MVKCLPGLLIQNKKPGRRTVFQGILGNQFLGQVKIKILYVHVLLLLSFDYNFRGGSAAVNFLQIRVRFHRRLLLLLKRKEKDVWETLVKPGKKARPGTVISFGGGLLAGEVIDVVEEGNRLIRFSYDESRYGSIYDILHRIGLMPLPPYITEQLRDNDRYQTVYARETWGLAPSARSRPSAWTSM